MAWQEGRLLRWIAERVPPGEGVLLGPGDDAALIAPRVGPQAWTVDQVVEGVHYDAGEDPARVARKLVGRNVSDLAAMGALPRFALVASAASDAVEETWLRAYLEALLGELARHGVALVGGDLARAPAGFASSLTLIGDAPERPARRAAGRAGDVLCVTGALGGSRAGRHLDPPDRVAVGRWLVETAEVACMIDLSDGLVLDLARVCAASELGARVETERIPLHPDAHAAAARSGRSALEHALCDGEDYELLFALAPERLPRLANVPTRCPIATIGTLEGNASGIAWIDGAGQALDTRTWRGWEHGGSTE